MLCIGKCVGSLSMYGGGLGCSSGGGVEGRWDALAVLCVCYGLVFCMHFHGVWCHVC